MSEEIKMTKYLPLNTRTLHARIQLAEFMAELAANHALSPQEEIDLLHRQCGISVEAYGIVQKEVREVEE